MSILRRLITTIVGSVGRGMHRVACWLRLRKRLRLTRDTNIGTIMNHAMSLTTKREASAFYNEVLEWSMENWNVPKFECTRENAIKLLRKNLLYWADRFSKRTPKEIGELYDL